MFTSDNIADARVLITRSEEAAEGDSNDAEIQALQDARDALSDLVEAAQKTTRRASEITVGIWVSELDGVPVVQIDAPATTGRFRVNVNDGAIWDQGTETDFTPPTEHKTPGIVGMTQTRLAEVIAAAVTADREKRQAALTTVLDAAANWRDELTGDISGYAAADEQADYARSAQMIDAEIEELRA